MSHPVRYAPTRMKRTFQLTLPRNLWAFIEARCRTTGESAEAYLARVVKEEIKKSWKPTRKRFNTTLS